MKLNKREIYEIGKKILKESTIGFENFLKEIEFAPITKNPYVMIRDNDELSAFMLFDFKEYEASAKRILKKMLDEIEVPEENHNYLIKVFRDSYVSLFRIKEKDDHFSFYDVLLNEYIEVENYTPINLTSKSEFGLYRIFGDEKRKSILQVIQIMDEEVFFSFSENIINLIYHIEENFGPVKVNKEFLKREFLNIIAIFGVTLESINKDFLHPNEDFEDLDGLEDFAYLLSSFYEEDFLIPQDPKLFQKIFPGEDVEFIMGFFFSLFSKLNQCISSSDDEKEKTFKDYDLNYKEMIKDLCESGDFLSREDLTKSIDFLLVFYGQLQIMGRGVKNILKDLGDIKKNIFYYMELLKNSESGFYSDDNILDILYDNKKAVFGNNFIENFDSFITFLDMNYVNLLKSGDLSPAMLKEFSSTINLKPIKDVKTLKNKHLPLIELYLNFMLKKYLTLISGDYFPQELYLTDYADEYQALDDTTKLSIWIESLTNKKFLEASFGINYEKYSGFVRELLQNLKEKKEIKNIDFAEDEMALLNILKDLEVIKIKEIDKTIKLTKFGKDIYNYFTTEEISSNNIIKVNFKDEK
ncbi:hypothetical protein [Peptoniphilus senegalensis]|uniref:hypothetical protein n=1 Tax=Peptoniphilus senegalensis TaxID=1465757 RepID=UPI00031E0180|nr:hypothetical protein [Peptoniphilus senegalensis]